MDNTFDIIIIGSGITGSLIARYLSKYELKILVIEKETDVGMCPSSANSAIIHSGTDPKPGTLKAKMNVEGNALWHPLASELGIQYKRTGSYVVAIGEEASRLPSLLGRARENNIPGAEIISGEEFLKREPLANPGTSGALYAPTAAVIDPFGAVLAAAENAVMNGAVYLFETEFLDFIYGMTAKGGKKITGIKTNKGDFFCKTAVNAAGLYSDEIARKTGDRPGFSIIPYKGSYFVFDAAKIVLNSVLFPVPSETTKGILVSTTTHGNVLIGPDKEPAASKNDSATTKEGFKRILAGAKKLVPSIDEKNVIASYAGIRAAGTAGNFVIEESKEARGLINLMGIDSPGLASAPAIALYVVELIKSQIKDYRLKPGWNPIRPPKVHFHTLSTAEKTALVKKSPAYGRIICRCEEITEGEVLDAIRAPIPARTYDGIKRRTWLGTGRCQGSFDYPRVIQILARELNIPVEQVTKKGRGSGIVFRKTKDVSCEK